MALREGGRIVSMAVTEAVAVDTDGRREILAITVMPSEAETFWADFLRVRRQITGSPGTPPRLRLANVRRMFHLPDVSDVEVFR